MNWINEHMNLILYFQAEFKVIPTGNFTTCTIEIICIICILVVKCLLYLFDWEIYNESVSLVHFFLLVKNKQTSLRSILLLGEIVGGE